jgi:hypothetical protein
MTDIIKTYQIFSATCKVLSRIDWLGNYHLNSVTEKDLQYVGQAKNVEQYLKQFIDIVKVRILKKISDINTVKRNIKGLDETIGLHLFIREIGKILQKFIKIELTKNILIMLKTKGIDKHNINFN